MDLTWTSEGKYSGEGNNEGNERSGQGRCSGQGDDGGDERSGEDRRSGQGEDFGEAFITKARV